MFEVRATFLLDDLWEMRDRKVRGMTKVIVSTAMTGNGERDLIWHIEDFDAAKRLVKDLRSVEGVSASLRECDVNLRKPKR